jgi:hypothetical protein
MANGIGHKILTRAALESLPAWMQSLIAPVKAKFEDEYCMYGDTYFANIQQIGPYIELPDGRLPMDPWEIRHFGKDAPGKDYYTCEYYDLMRYSFEYFAKKCIDSIKKNNITEFAKFAGSISHIIEDCGTPSHAVGTEMGTDMKMIKLLYPTSDKKKMADQFHVILESKFECFSLEYTPQLLGCTPVEISFNMLERFTDMLENSISFIIPLLDAFYSDNDKLLAQRLTACGKFASEIVADFIYSVISIAKEQLDATESELLNSISLSEFTPIKRTAWALPPYIYSEIRKAPWNLNKQYAPVPLALLIDEKEKIFEKGFGIGPPFTMSYLLPVGIYTQFSSTVGINSRLGTASGVTFKVLGNGIELVRKTCNTINDTQIINCNIENVHKLTLKITPSGNISSSSNSHAVWGNPRLLKNTR